VKAFASTSSVNISEGFFQPWILRGRSLISEATIARYFGSKVIGMPLGKFTPASAVLISVVTDPTTMSSLSELHRFHDTPAWSMAGGMAPIPEPERPRRRLFLGRRLVRRLDSQEVNSTVVLPLLLSCPG
jgi:hypothetical protein